MKHSLLNRQLIIRANALPGLKREGVHTNFIGPRLALIIAHICCGIVSTTLCNIKTFNEVLVRTLWWSVHVKTIPHAP